MFIPVPSIHSGPSIYSGPSVYRGPSVYSGPSGHQSTSEITKGEKTHRSCSADLDPRISTGPDPEPVL
jgi:hypothetical protein